MKTQLHHNTNDTQRQYIGFSQRDEKGRQCGVVIARWSAEAVQVADDSNNAYTDRFAPGFYQFARVQPTRNNQSYGASTDAFGSRDDAEVEGWIAKRVRETERRYARKYGS
jgi:hypothetical protein